METNALMVGVIIFGVILLIGLVALNAIIPEEIFNAPHAPGDSEENNSDLVLVQGTPYPKRLF